MVLTPDNQFKLATPADIIYDKLDDFIEGVIVKTNKKKTPEQFLKACETDKQTLHLTAIVKDALFYRNLVRGSDGYYFNPETEARYGKSEIEIVEFLKNPLNQSELDNISEKIEAKWNQ
jgi:hypothetical protein